ncbi:MAG: ABC transporter substrate-binding protein [Pseudomonadota bacterium]|nr:ABC transporter substrate-binding protein [Pseudomonadota bacterium]
MSLRRFALALVLAATVAPGPACPGLAQPASAPAEVQYFWESPAELSALSVIADRFTALGGNWVGVPTTSARENRILAIQRISRGVPPFAIQWHAGRDIGLIADSGVIMDLSALAADAGWREMLNPTVPDWITRDGATLALPVAIHAENWAWYNSAILRAIGAGAPGDWTALAAVLETARDAGYPGIAMSPEPWQRMLLFWQVLAGAPDPDLARALVGEGDPSVVDRDSFRTAFGDFARLRRFDAHLPGVAGWRDAAEAVLRGDALVHFMGDWVLAEFRRQGAVAGRDFECVIGTGAVRRHLSVIDVFIFPRTGDRALTGDHRRLAATVLDRTVQAEFARRKGAIPVRADLHAEIDDPCSQSAYDTLGDGSRSVPAAAMFADERLLAALTGVIDDFWGNLDTDVATGIERIRAALAGARRN